MRGWIFRSALCALLLIAGHHAWADWAGGGVSSSVFAPISLNDGATITVPCPSPYSSVTYYLTLTGNNHQILFPSCPANANGASVKFRITAGSTAGLPYTGLSFSPGFSWAGGSPYAICTAATTPNPACPTAEAANQVDWFGCDVVGTAAPSAEWDCWTPQYNVNNGIFRVVSSNSCASAGGGACTTSATNMVGADLIVGCIGYYNGAGGTSAFLDSQGNPYTQVYSTFNSNIGGILVYTRAPVVSGSMTFTASISGSTPFPALGAIGFSGSVASPLDQSTSPAASTGSATTLQPGSLTPGQANELLVTCLAGNTVGPSVGTPFVAGPAVGWVASTTEGVAMGYQIQNPGPATENPTWTWSGANAAVAGQATFK